MYSVAGIMTNKGDVGKKSLKEMKHVDWEFCNLRTTGTNQGRIAPAAETICNHITIETQIVRFTSCLPSANIAMNPILGIG